MANPQQILPVKVVVMHGKIRFAFGIKMLHTEVVNLAFLIGKSNINFAVGAKPMLVF